MHRLYDCLVVVAPTGLLAGLWEFPAVLAAGGVVTQAQRWKQLQGAIAEDCHFDGDFIGTVCAVARFVCLPGELMPLLQVTHHFSHVHHQYHCWYVRFGTEAHDKVSTWLSGSSGSVKAGGMVRWTDRSDLCRSAVPASVKKVTRTTSSLCMYVFMYT